MQKTSIYKTPEGEQAVMDFYERTLSHWPVPFERLDIPTRYGRTFGLTCGNPDGPALVLLHGAGSNSSVWMGATPILGRQYRLYAVDLIGEPGKSSPIRPAWNSPAFCEWLEDVFNALGLQSAALCGISQGGWTALKFSVAYPERVNKLILLSPGGIVPDKLTFLLSVIPLSMMGRWGNKQIMRMIFAGKPVVKELDEAITLINSHFIPRMGVLPIFSDEDLERLTMPTLLLMGDKDVLRDAQKIKERLEAHLLHFSAEIIPGGGHALLDTNQQILAFMGLN